MNIVFFLIFESALVLFIKLKRKSIDVCVDDKKNQEREAIKIRKKKSWCFREENFFYVKEEKKPVEFDWNKNNHNDK